VGEDLHGVAPVGHSLYPGDEAVEQVAIQREVHGDLWFFLLMKIQFKQIS
jgi:hypothetical protein